MGYEINDIIGGYQLTSAFSNKGAGQCQWAFAKRDGKEYFIKMFLSPKYPLPSSKIDEDKKEKKKARCREFEGKQRKVIDLLKSRTKEGGNLVPARDFFRDGSVYFKVTEKIEAHDGDVLRAPKLPERERNLLLRTLTNSLKILHSIKLVHCDLKPENILISETNKGNYVSKLIDFDDSIFSRDSSVELESIIGDPRYYSPELMILNMGIEDHRKSVITTKSDIFALGIIFHEFWTGNRPGFSRDTYKYASSVVLSNDKLILDEGIPSWLKKLIEQMLSLSPEKRPSASEILECLKNKSHPKEVESRLKGDLSKKFKR